MNLYNDIIQTVTNIKNKFNNEALLCDNIKLLHLLKQSYINNHINTLTQNIKNINSIEDKKKVGQAINQCKRYIIDYNIKLKDDTSNNEYVNMSLYIDNIKTGSIHPVRQMLKKITNICISLGYDIKDGPEIEKIDYCFDKLNIPTTHPSRKTSDTFYIKDSKEYVMRPHTSSVQIKTLLHNKPPVQIISTGKVFRNDDNDRTHNQFFHQIEGLTVNKTASYIDLYNILNYMAINIFNSDTKIRFRTSYFPFTEPSMEVDISCQICKQKNIDCKTCKNIGWIEWGGCGLVNSQVLKNCNIDSSIYRGFAFGMGIERTIMMQQNISDIRLLFNNDINIYQQIKI